MSVEPFATPSATTSPSRNRWVDKLTSHFGNRNRNITEFYVQPDDPWRAYFPGDIIKGTVVLTVAKPIRITHLVICLHAYVKVFKTTVPPGEAGPEIGFLGPGRGRRSGQYMGNGFATLFEDEVVLCGDGRLKEGIYKFQFELQLPPYNLPSSITVRASCPECCWGPIRLTNSCAFQFERGTISYVITSTLTRPTTIAPTMSCHRRITVLEDLDIAPIPAPKPRVVSLQPISKRPRPRPRRKASAGDPGLHAGSDSTVNGQETRPPLTPTASDVSGSSRVSSSSQSFRQRTDSMRTASFQSNGGRSTATSTSLTEKTIMATAELQRSGALPGDSIPIKITINHTRHVRSPHGIIITLYRQGRIDMHPAIPLGTPGPDGKVVYEDLFPKSRTGLSGLWLGTSRTSSIFRKDLTQTFAPLVVDPQTMTATVKTSVRIPADAFPTITRVPGGMISFRYYVEIVADLRGKLDRFLPRLHMVSSGRNYSPNGQVFTFSEQTANSITSNWAGNILDTDQIRREKGVVDMLFEIVVGTRDSARRARQDSEENGSTTVNGNHVQYADDEPQGDHDDFGEYCPNGVYSGDEEYHGQEDEYWSEYPNSNEPPYQSLGEALQGPLPPPPMPQEPEDEKARIRRAEEALLPSRPPGDPDAGPSAGAPAPTAPELPEDDENWSGANGLPGPAPPSAMALAEAPMPGPSQPLVSGLHPTDDKQELERQRLLREASAPEPSPSAGPEPNGFAHAGPSAPVLDDEESISNLDHDGGEAPPQYQR